MDKDRIYDLAIIGAGPAGLAASIYASRYSLEHKIVGTVLGGQISEAHIIDNYPGIPGISGSELSQKWGDHAKKYRTEIVPNLVKSMEKSGSFKLTLDNEKVISARAILLATGTKRRKLNVLGEAEFLGRGVSYCATCDGFFYKDKIVGVVGGGDTAASAAVYLSGICQKVYIIYRKEKLRAEPFWAKLIEKNSKIEVIFNTNILEIIGLDKLEKIKLDKEYNGEKELYLNGIFIEVGSDPDISYAKNLGIDTDEGGYVKIKRGGATSVLGIWAAGDITDGSDKFRQVITAAAEGAVAVRSIFNYFKRLK